MPKYNEFGEEILDPTPLRLPIGFEVPESLDAKLARMLKQQRLRDHFDRISSKIDEDDFGDNDPEDDDFGPTPFELVEDPSGKEVTRAEAQYLNSLRLQADKKIKEKIIRDKKRKIEREAQAKLRAEAKQNDPK